jgi:uncharacterized protein (TIGR03086 family)
MTPSAVAAAPAVPFAPTSSPTFALLGRAIGQAGTVIAAVRPGQESRPTPCASWDVRDLVSHVVDEVHRFARVTAGRGVVPAAGPLGPLVDWVDAYRDAARALLAAWSAPGVPDSAANWLMGQQLTELAVHAWDVAVSTGQSTELDVEVGEAALAWGRDNLRPESRGDEASGAHVGPAVPVPDDAPLYDRLAAFGGRTPR